MAEATTNQTGNVSVGKGAAGAYAWIAPYGTALPTDNKTSIAPTYKVLGFIDENGVTFSDSSSPTDFNDMSGDSIATAPGAITKTAAFTPVELKKTTLELIYGATNVEDASGVIEYTDAGPDQTLWTLVFDFVLGGSRKWRVVVPQCRLKELADLTINYQTLVGRQNTMAVLYDSTIQGYYKGYLDSTETEAA